MWENYKNFDLATYVWAFYLVKATDDEIRRDVEIFRSYSPLKKVYLENHRSNVDVPQKRMREVKALFEEMGIETSGGITSTGLVDGQKKPSIFDTFCYTDERHRANYLRIVEELAEVFDEIILDDFFFTACRCEKCIAAKGDKTWSRYRLDLMEDFSKVIVNRAHEINPKLNFIIKYPAWYKSYHETGYNPKKEREIFDTIYTGTETREPVYNAQHLQRYHSYSIMRFLENAAPGHNGGGWIDAGGSGDNINRFLEQAEQTIFAKAKELTLWNFNQMIQRGTNVLPAAARDLYRVDEIAGQLGKPVGLAAYEPFDSDGEDLIYNFLGMGGIAIEPSPDFDEKAKTILLTESSAADPEIIDRAKAFLTGGGNVVLTTGFIRKTLDRGVRDITSLQLTGRYLSGRDFMTGERYYSDDGRVIRGYDPILFEILQFKDNASWSDLSVCSEEFNGPVLTEEDYANGRVFVLNLPQNPADLYRMPEKAWHIIAKYLSIGQRVYVSADEKISFFAYDNGVYGVQNFAPHGSRVSVVVRGECKGIQDIETGEIYDLVSPLPGQSIPHDAAGFIPEPREFCVELPVGAGGYRFFRVL